MLQNVKEFAQNDDGTEMWHKNLFVTIGIGYNRNVILTTCFIYEGYRAC